MVTSKLDKLSQQVYELEKEAGFQNTKKEKLLSWIKEELKNYEKTKEKSEKQNKLVDIVILIMQIARRENISLDEAWNKWWIKSKKYIK